MTQYPTYVDPGCEAGGEEIWRYNAATGEAWVNPTYRIEWDGTPDGPIRFVKRSDPGTA
jgi:predicted secreted protein